MRFQHGRSFALACCSVAALACGPAPAPAPTTGELLWTVEYRDSKVASLFGTIHTRSLEDARTFHPRALAEFDRASVLFVETDVSSIDVGQYTELALADSSAPGLDTQLTAAEWDQLSQATRDVVQVEVLRRAEPWYATQLFLQAILASRATPAKKAMDQELIDEARARGIEVKFLEDWKEPIFALSRTIALPELKATLERGIEGGLQDIGELEEDWELGDVPALESRISAIEAEQLRLLFHERNDRWSFKIGSAMIDGGQAFVAVGAGHLAGGPKSLPGELVELGLVVTRRP